MLYIDDFIDYTASGNVRYGGRFKDEIVKQHANMYSKELTIEWCWQKLGDAGAARVVELYRQGVPVHDIMLELGLRSPTCIYAVLEQYGITPNRQKRKRKRRRLTEEEKKKIAEMYREGKSIYAIAKELGRSEYLINYWLKKMGLK